MTGIYNCNTTLNEIIHAHDKIFYFIIYKFSKNTLLGVSGYGNGGLDTQHLKVCFIIVNVYSSHNKGQSSWVCWLFLHSVVFIFPKDPVFILLNIWTRRNPQTLTEIIWATSWENPFSPHANNKGADQTAHPRSLISVFAVRFQDSILPILAKFKLSRL